MNNHITYFFLVLILFSSSTLISQDYTDCDKAFTICGDESSYTFASATDIGQDELFTDDFCIGRESAPTWIEWTLEEGGLLTFVLTPENDIDDLDFLIFEVTGDLCSDDITAIRCMASGETLGSPSEVCMGPTGLAQGETDTEERASCDNGSNNFLAPIETSIGDRYVMVVNNFSSTGLGFGLEFSGAAIGCEPPPNSSENLNTDTELFSFTQNASELTLTLFSENSHQADYTIYNMVVKKLSPLLPRIKRKRLTPIV